MTVGQTTTLLAAGPLTPLPASCNHSSDRDENATLHQLPLGGHCARRDVATVPPLSVAVGGVRPLMPFHSRSFT